MRNEGARPGDLLILTKPLGTGILNTGIKGDMVSEEGANKLVAVMAALNGRAAQVMKSVRTHAATDVTGFGLIGHLSEMLKHTLAVRLFADKLPYFEEAPELSRSGFLPGGLHRNRDFYGKRVVGTTDSFRMDLIFDPQTSGGLLMAVDPEDQSRFEEEAARLGTTYWIIGEFVEDPKGTILLA